MKRVAYFLIFLMLLGQAEDALSWTPLLPSAPLEDDNDEYLQGESIPRRERTSRASQPRFVRAPIAGHTSARREILTERNRALPPGSLYVFMSLQI
jgi:hypothetical protein